MRNKVVLKHFGMAYVKCMLSMAAAYMILENGGWGRPTNSIISKVLLILEH